MISPPDMFPLSKSFNHKMRPLLDAVDKLRAMGAVEEGINLPTIVVVGDQSSGKTSVLESLSGVELPKGLTRVPLILTLKGSPLTKITISYKNKPTAEHVFMKEIAETEITDAITSATDALAGSGKGIAASPITLYVSKPGAPDLTLVDLPGITRVPVHDQPSNIYESLHALIQQYIKPKETIILNVLSAAMDFSVCESIHMSRQVDKLGNRTLAVVTKVDLCPDGLVEKITNDARKIGLVGYIFVCNRTAKEASFEEAAEAERVFFSSHTELKSLSKSVVGVEALAGRLMQLQAQSVAGVLPRTLKQIDNSMDKKWDELEQMGCEGISNAVDASVTFFNVSCSVRKSLEMILSGSASSQPQHHYIANLHKRFEQLSSMLTDKLTTTYGRDRKVDWGQMEQIKQLLSECQYTNLPNVFPQSIIEKMVSQIIDSIADTCTSELPSFVHEEARKVAFSVAFSHARRFPYLKKLYTAAFQKALNQCRSECSSTIIARLLDMEKAIIYTTGSKLYNGLVNRIQVGKCELSFHQSYKLYLWPPYEQMLHMGIEDPEKETEKETEKQAAFSVLAYWIIVSRRLADHIPRELRFSFNEALLSVTDEVVGQVVGGSLSMEQVMAEQPEVANERQRLKASLDVLHQSKELISQVLDDAWATGWSEKS